MKKLILTLIALTMLVTGCSIPETAADETAIQVGAGPFDGRTATCVIYEDARWEQGGVSCDFPDNP